LCSSHYLLFWFEFAHLLRQCGLKICQWKKRSTGCCSECTCLDISLLACLEPPFHWNQNLDWSHLAGILIENTSPLIINILNLNRGRYWLEFHLISFLNTILMWGRIPDNFSGKMCPQDKPHLCFHLWAHHLSRTNFYHLWIPRIWWQPSRKFRIQSLYRY
jgi:hypothetical protein